jgi:C-terminal processing protease CtpA/Prc
MERGSIVRAIVAWLGALALAGLALLTIVQQRTISRLREREQGLQGDLSELERSRAQTPEAAAFTNQEAELAQLRENTRDLMRLRNEVRQLRDQAGETALLREANARLLELVQHVQLSSNQQAVVAAVRKKGAVLGIFARSASDPQAGATAAASSAGVVVVGLDSESPAMQSGLRSGDVVIRLDGRPVDTLAQLQIEMLTKQPGETVMLDVVRGNEVLRIPVKTRAMP